MIEAMIDLETLGKNTDAVIASIAVVLFDRNDSPGTFGKTWERKLEVRTQPGRVCDPDTVMWWMGKGMADAREMTFVPKGKGTRLGLALKELDDFLKDNNVKRLWGCGPDFDCKILEHAYAQYNQQLRIPFYKWSCIRTVEDLVWEKKTRKEGGENWIEGSVTHDALNDCRLQILTVQNARRQFKHGAAALDAVDMLSKTEGFTDMVKNMDEDTKDKLHRILLTL